MTYDHKEREFVAKYLDRLKPTLVAVCDSDTSESSHYYLYKEVNNDRPPVYDHSHDEMVCVNVAKWVSDKTLLPIVSSWRTSTGFQDMIHAAVDEGVKAYALPWQITSGWAMGDSIKYADDHDCVQCGPMMSGFEFPAGVADTYKSILAIKACRVDGSILNKGYRDITRTIHVIAGSPSASTGVAAGAVCLLRGLAPEKTAAEIVDIIFDTADDVDGKPWLNMLAAANFITGDYSPAPYVPPLPDPVGPETKIETVLGELTTTSKWVYGDWSGYDCHPVRLFDGNPATIALALINHTSFEVVSPPSKTLNSVSVTRSPEGADFLNWNPSKVMFKMLDATEVVAEFELWTNDADKRIQTVSVAPFDTSNLKEVHVYADNTTSTVGRMYFSELNFGFSDGTPIPDPTPEPTGSIPTPNPEPTPEPTGSIPTPEPDPTGSLSVYPKTMTVYYSNDNTEVFNLNSFSQL